MKCKWCEYDMNDLTPTGRKRKSPFCDQHCYNSDKRSKLRKKKKDEKKE